MLGLIGQWFVQKAWLKAVLTQGAIHAMTDMECELAAKHALRGKRLEKTFTCFTSLSNLTVIAMGGGVSAAKEILALRLYCKTT